MLIFHSPRGEPARRAALLLTRVGFSDLDTGDHGRFSCGGCAAPNCSPFTASAQNANAGTPALESRRSIMDESMMLPVMDS